LPKDQNLYHGRIEMSLTTFSDIPRSVLALLLDGVGKPQGISPRLIMGEPGTIGPQERAELYAGGFIEIPDKLKIKLTPQFVSVARVVLNPHTNLTIRIWGKESICGETNIQFPRDIMTGGGVILNQMGRMYRISAFVDDSTVVKMMGEAIPEPLEQDLQFEFKAHLDNPVAAILFAVIDLARIRVSEAKKALPVLNMSFNTQDVYNYMNDRWLFTGFKDLITYITAVGIMTEPPSLTDTVDGLRLLSKAGILKENRTDIYGLTKAIEPLVSLTIGQPSGVQWQRISLLDNGEQFISNRMFLFADKALMLCIAPTIKGRLFISRVRRQEITDFLKEEIMATLIPTSRAVAGSAAIESAPSVTTAKAPPAAAAPIGTPRVGQSIPPPARPAPAVAQSKPPIARPTPPPVMAPRPAITPPPAMHPRPVVTPPVAVPRAPVAAPRPIATPHPMVPAPPPVMPAPASQTQTCAQCGAVLRPNAKFCSKCGATITAPKPTAPVSASCPNCGQPLKPGAKFCSKCGAVISGQPAPPRPPTCPRCGRPLKPGARFCAGCGTQL
jgi:predicted nucleic acid-binding Zn ribbon protein